MSLVSRIAGAWRAPGASWRAEWADGAGEPRLVAYAMGASAFLALGDVAAEAIRPVLAVGEGREAWFASRVFAGLSFFPLALYLSAALIRLVCRVAGGRGGWRETRLALFWSGLVSGPAAAVVIALGAAAAQPEAARLAAGLLWVGLLSPMLAAAHGFRAGSVLLVFLGFAALSFALARFG
ncbi:MAG: hypothetical protein ACE37J_10385 [Pikeienuella sp.]|uniref:hypothetical protein n=1 Tax=Pikeienuella sp. TaxID=2831957 RepID=UPI00391C1695